MNTKPAELLDPRPIIQQNSGKFCGGTVNKCEAVSGKCMTGCPSGYSRLGIYFPFLVIIKF